MHSIDAEQQERNHEDLSGERAVAKMRELAKSAPTCFFCSAFENDQPFRARPMSVQEVDDEGALWFLAPSDGELVDELTHSDRVQLLFQGSAHSEFLSLEGNAVVTIDKERIRELWQPIFATWFTGGVDDPRIVVIRVDPTGGYYWDTKHGRAVAMAKMVAGAVLGKTLDDSLQGRLSM